MTVDTQCFVFVKAEYVSASFGLFCFVLLLFVDTNTNTHLQSFQLPSGHFCFYCKISLGSHSLKWSHKYQFSEANILFGQCNRSRLASTDSITLFFDPCAEAKEFIYVIAHFILMILLASTRRFLYFLKPQIIFISFGIFLLTVFWSLFFIFQTAQTIDNTTMQIFFK